MGWTCIGEQSGRYRVVVRKL